jgi:hypothetical protein
MRSSEADDQRKQTASGRPLAEMPQAKQGWTRIHEPYECTMIVLLRVITTRTRNPQRQVNSVMERPNNPSRVVTQGASVQQPGTHTGTSTGLHVHGS